VTKGCARIDLVSSVSGVLADLEALACTLAVSASAQHNNKPRDRREVEMGIDRILMGASCKTSIAGDIFSHLEAKLAGAGGHFWHDVFSTTTS
jgi:hypothetical protein